MAPSGGYVMLSWRRLVQKSRTSSVKIRAGFLSGALWWIGRVLVSPLTDNSRTNIVQIRVSYFLNDVKMELGVM